MWLLLIFIAVPIVEIALFIQVGGLIGLWPTLALVLLTAFVGTALMRSQGLQTLAQLQRGLAEGHDPVSPIAHGALILVAGVLLLTPGFFTDALGLSLLAPPIRMWLVRWGASRLAAKGATIIRSRAPARHGDTIEADYEIVDEPRPARPGRSGWTRPGN